MLHRNMAVGAWTALIVTGASADVRAQIGSGWSQYTSTKSIQRDGSTAYYSNVNGIETFRIGSGDRRSEVQLNSKWSSGQRQFEGSVSCKSGSGGDGGASIQQIMRDGDPDGDIQQVRVYNVSGGTLKIAGGGSTLATGIYGVWVRVNVIHNRSTNVADTYINGARKSSRTLAGGSTNYFKYGIYLRAGQTQWRNIRNWRK